MNSDLTHKTFKCPINGKTYSYENMVKMKSEIKNDKTSLPNELKDWVVKTLDNTTGAIDARKQSIYKADGIGGKKGGNVFKDTHSKKETPWGINPDKSKDRPVDIGKPINLGKNSKSNYIFTDKAPMEEEIKTIKYLIEYMNNNNKRID